MDGDFSQPWGFKQQTLGEKGAEWIRSSWSVAVHGTR